jgi:hypothetical protein
MIIFIPLISFYYSIQYVYPSYDKSSITPYTICLCSTNCDLVNNVIYYNQNVQGSKFQALIKNNYSTVTYFNTLCSFSAFYFNNGIYCNRPLSLRTFLNRSPYNPKIYLTIITKTKVKPACKSNFSAVVSIYMPVITV